LKNNKLRAWRAKGKAAAKGYLMWQLSLSKQIVQEWGSVWKIYFSHTRFVLTHKL